MLAPSSDRILVELFQILKDDAVESAALNIQYALNMQYAGSRQKVGIGSQVRFHRGHDIFEQVMNWEARSAK